MTKILITYASATGTTKEIAGEIGKVLEEKGLVTELKAMSEVQELEKYSGVIMGAPINGMQWLPEASNFVEAHQGKLQQVPTACFLVSYLLMTGREGWKKVIRKSLNKVKAKINPVMVGMFGGKIGEDFPAVARFIFGIKKDAPKDARDWQTIRNWATELGAYFK